MGKCREEAQQEEEELMLGGIESKLQRNTPYKQRWKLMKDGDLWENFADIVKQRGPHSVWITKVKGHATQEIVDEGKVEEEEKKGNDDSDKAAGMGSTSSRGKIARINDMYSWRRAQYRS